VTEVGAEPRNGAVGVRRHRPGDSTRGVALRAVERGVQAARAPAAARRPGSAPAARFAGNSERHRTTTNDTAAAAAAATSITVM
jgi:hypothetical protein